MAASITIPIDPETQKLLIALSKERDCTEIQLAQAALREFLALQTWHMQAIDEGVAAADQGRLIAHEEIRQYWESKLGNQVD